MTALFPPGKGGGKEVSYGFKGKGVLIHFIVDGEGMPLAFSITASNGNERTEAVKNIAKINVSNGKPGRPRRCPRIVAGDKGYDSKKMRQTLRRKGIKPEIPKRLWKNKEPLGRPLIKTVKRFVVERAFSWMQRKFRRIAVRWERLPSCFSTFVNLAVIMLWIQRIL